MSAHDLPVTVSIFPRAEVDGEAAYGRHNHTTWGEFSAHLQQRREGEKDGACFAAATFKLYSGSATSCISASGVEVVRRLKKNVTARTMVALDIETSKKTGEIPPSIERTMSIVKANGWACAAYTSHNCEPETNLRYRLILPMTDAIAVDLPCPDVVAGRLGLLGVLDASKVGASSLFYFPSCPPGRLALHQSILVDGKPMDATGLMWAADNLKKTREAEKERIAAAAHAEASARRAERLAAGFDPDDSLIEKLRAHYDLAAVLMAHGYDQSGKKYRHPNSSSGLHGADIKMLGGIERVFSHNATDPLHADNLPEWCGTVTALDVFDVVAILDFGADRRRALRELATKHSLNKTAERKQIAKLLFRLIKRRTRQAEIETTAYAEGRKLGLSTQEVIQIATWVVEQNAARERRV